MKYGDFHDDSREFVITRPDTPLPWLNVLGQEELFGLCTNTGGGYTFWKDARYRRLTRYRYNDMPMDGNGRILYIRDGGEVWNPGWKPVKTPLDAYTCRHGLGYTTLRAERNGLECEVCFFIAPEEPVEIWNATLRNRSGEAKDISVFSFVEFCLYDALNDMTNYQRTWSIGEVEVEGSGIYHKTEYRERRNHYTFFGCTAPVAGVDISRDRFVGVHNGLHEARVPREGASGGGETCGWNPIGSHHVRLVLGPGEEESFAFLLAYVEEDPAEKFEAPGVLNKRRGRALLERYRNAAEIDRAFAALGALWQDRLGRFQAECPNEHLRRMVNIWNPAQCMATFHLSRSASGFESGIGRGMGFRDSNQDVLGFVHMEPGRARERILAIAATQLSDGTCYHQYQPLTGRGNADIGGDFYDDHLWLILSACAYIRETGDASLLHARVGFADEDESSATLLDHLELSLDYTLRHRGPHGLPLIGHADWNDCLNLNCFSTDPNESFQTAGDVEGSIAESVMIAGLFLVAAQDMASLYRHLGRAEDAGRIDRSYGAMLDAVETHAWDGDWYIRAFDAHGQPVGSSRCEEGRIYIESQAWCVLGGAGRDNSRARKALESVERELQTPNGIILQQPPYRGYHVELGEVSSYPPGFKENGGIFSHNNTWIHLGWCLLGEGERALRAYLSICPSAKQDQIDVYRSEPYVYAQMTAGPDSPAPGEAKNSWLTGTAAWSFVVASQGILGIRPEYGGLRVDPCIPAAWNGFRVTRRFRGATYHIAVHNPDGVCHGVRRVTVDGTPHPDNLLPPAPAGAVVRVDVVLGD
jgi:cellobiose phosphorylase